MDPSPTQPWPCVYPASTATYDLSLVFPHEAPLSVASFSEVLWSPCGELRCDDLYAPKTGDGAVLEMHSDQATNGCNNVWGRSATAVQKPTFAELSANEPDCVEEPCGFRINYYDGDTAVVFRTAEARVLCAEGVYPPQASVLQGNVMTINVKIDCSRLIAHQALPVLPDFDMNRFEGEWYDISSSTHAYSNQEVAGVCKTANYTIADGAVSAVYSQRMGWFGGELVTETTELLQQHPERPNYMRQKLDDGAIMDMDFTVLALDEEADDYRYALVGDYLRRNLMLLSRTLLLDSDAHRFLMIEAEKQEFDVNALQFVMSNHDDRCGH